MKMINLSYALPNTLQLKLKSLYSEKSSKRFEYTKVVLRSNLPTSKEKALALIPNLSSFSSSNFCCNEVLGHAWNLSKSYKLNALAKLQQNLCESTRGWDTLQTFYFQKEHSNTFLGFSTFWSEGWNVVKTFRHGAHQISRSERNGDEAFHHWLRAIETTKPAKNLKERNLFAS